MGVPYTFQNVAGGSNIPLSELDENFQTPITLGTAPVALGETLPAATVLSAIGAYPASNPNNYGSGTVTSVSGTGSVNGITLTGTVTSTGSLTLGGSLTITPASFGSQTQNTVLAAPNGSSGSATFRALVSADIPSLNYVVPGGALGTPSSGTLSNCSGSLSNCTVDGTVPVGYLTIPQNSQSTAYTLALTDSGKHIYHPSADTTARIWTIPANASVPFPIGTAITLVNDTSAGAITIAITSDTLVWSPSGSTGSRTLAANGMATIIKITSTRWMISGTGLT